MNKSEILEEALGLINGPRSSSYGSFADQMLSIADAFNGLMNRPQYGTALTPRDVALILQLLKMKRFLTSKGDLDSMIDLAGYAALTGEAFGSETEEERAYNTMDAHTVIESTRDFDQKAKMVDPYTWPKVDLP